MNQLPPYISRELIHERLPLIFPEGTPNRNYCIREMAASTIFTMLYIGAVQGTDIYLGPKHVYRMTVEQAANQDVGSRIAYASILKRKDASVMGKRWYADNTREPIRDETLREGLVSIGAVVAREDLPTTSSTPKYQLQKDFAGLFDPNLPIEEISERIANWQHDNLSASALARISLANRSAGGAVNKVLVTFPNGEARILSAGPSSEISKQVIEVFAKKFLENPVVLWLSTSDAKVSYMDNATASRIGLVIEADKNLPDIILVDLGKKNPLLMFIEVVATDGPVTQRRKDALYKLTDAAGFDRTHISFVTVFRDRQSPAFRKTVAELAWGSFAWFVSEPDKLVYFSDDQEKIIDVISRR